jgi:hypothetical protein
VRLAVTFVRCCAEHGTAQRLLDVAKTTSRCRNCVDDGAFGAFCRPQRAAEPVSGPNPDNLVDLTGQSDDEEVIYMLNITSVLLQ